MVIAAQCVPVHSSWVHQFVLTCDNELAVQFENGVCCLYPGTTRALFEVALVWGSPGKFVHAFLYKIRPYRLIVPPCPAQDCGGTVQTGCCPLPLPTTLYATVTGGGICDGSYALTYEAPFLEFPTWDTTAPFGICGLLAGALTIQLSCLGNGSWRLFIDTDEEDQATFACAPLLISFAALDLRSCGGSASATLVVTT